MCLNGILFHFKYLLQIWDFGRFLEKQPYSKPEIICFWKHTASYLDT